MPNGYNQYIGMRYVPLIMGTWTDTVNYEPMVVVAYNGNSYISKTYVPAGTLPTNETYWMLAANYNAQVEQYRQEVRQYQQTVDGFSGDISDLEDGLSALQTRVGDNSDDITAIQGAIRELEYGYLMIGHINNTFNMGVMEIDATSTYTTAAWTLTNQTSPAANLRRLYPNGQFVYYPSGFFSTYANVASANGTVTESGSLADGTWSLSITVTGELHNNSGGRHTVQGNISGFLEFRE